MITLSTLIEQTTQLSLSGFKQSLEFQSEDTKYQSLSFEERLYHLFEAEINQRQDKRIKRMLSIAKLKDSSASLDQIQYLAKRKLDKSQILSLANCEFINKCQNILLTGATGTGKSFLAQAIARRAMGRKTGARGLRTILESTLLNSMYELPSLENVSKVVVDESVIDGESEPFILYENVPASKASGE